MSKWICYSCVSDDSIKPCIVEAGNYNKPDRCIQHMHVWSAKWERISEAEVAQHSATSNKSSFQFPKLEDVKTEVNIRLNKKHLPWSASAIVAASETYDIIVGNKKR